MSIFHTRLAEGNQVWCICKCSDAKTSAVAVKLMIQWQTHSSSKRVVHEISLREICKILQDCPWSSRNAWTLRSFSNLNLHSWDTVLQWNERTEVLKALKCTEALLLLTSADRFALRRPLSVFRWEHLRLDEFIPRASRESSEAEAAWEIYALNLRSNWIDGDGT